FCSTDPAPPPTFTLSLHDALPIFLIVEGLRFIEQHGRDVPVVKQVAHSAFFFLVVRLTGGLGFLASSRLFVSASMRLETLPFPRSEEHTSELQSRFDLVCRLLLEK